MTERAYGLSPWASPTVGQLAALLIRSGATSRADALIEKLQNGDVCGGPAGLAVFHAMLGEFDRAVEWAERGSTSGIRSWSGPCGRSSPLRGGRAWRER